MKRLTIAILFVQLFFSACENEIDPPVIYNVYPATEGPGNVVHMRGAFNGAQKSFVEVAFNGAKAEIMFQSDTVIKVIVPEDASTGKITVKCQGVVGKSTNDFEVLTGRWASEQEFPTGVQVGAAAFVIQGKAYICGGENDESLFNELWQYNPTTREWLEKASLPLSIGDESGVSFAGTFVLNNKAYLVGGRPIPILGGRGEGSSQVWEYDPSEDIWTRKNDFPIVVSTVAGFSLNGEGYMLTQNGLFVYNEEEDSWASRANSPIAYLANQGVMVIGDEAYLIGSEELYGVRRGWRYNAESNTWKQIKNLTTEENLPVGNVFSVGDKGYVCIQGYCWQFDAAHNSWIRKTSLPMWRFGGTYFSVDGKGYVLGGTSDNLQGDFWTFTP